MIKVAIHAAPGIPWHMPFAAKLSLGLKALGIPHMHSERRARETDIAILLGTSCWRDIEQTGKYLLVDRASFRDPEFVSLVWNGHGRRGDHKVPHRANGKRWDTIGVPVHPWQQGGHKVVVCGQMESYTKKWTMPKWYESLNGSCTHFRPHPAQPVNPTLLPEWLSFNDCARFLTLNSSVAVDAILHGIPTVVEDEGGMAWPGFQAADDRLPWLRWLAWTQFSHDEIQTGTPIKHLFEDL